MPKRANIEKIQLEQQVINEVSTTQLSDSNISPIQLKQNVAIVNPTLAPPGYYLVNDLPSKFAFYPQGTQIYVRKFTTHECKLLADHLHEEKDGFDAILNSVLSSCVKGLNIEDLIIKDRYFITFFILTITYPASKFYVPWQCVHCGESNKYSLDMEDIETIDFDTTNEIDDIVADEATFSYYPTTVRRKNLIELLVAQYGKETLDVLYLHILKNISKLNGIDDPLEIYNALAELPPADTMIITATIDDYEFGAIPEVDVQCEHCKEAGRMAIRFHGAFFMPKFIGRDVANKTSAISSK